VISLLLPAEDFARQLAYADLESAMATVAGERPFIVCSAMPDGLDAHRRDLGEARTEALLRELALFVRRNLRGVDLLSTVRDELVLVLDAPPAMAACVTDRLLAAVRGHVFSGGATDRSLRLTIAVGVALAPEHGATLEQLLSVAREARLVAESDGTSIARQGRPRTLDLHRFVGRSEQLASFSHYLDDMVRGVGRVVAVLGERGVGASALVRGLEPEVRLRGGSLVIGSAHDYLLPAPYALWSAVLRAIRRLPVKSTRVWRELPALERSLDARGDEPNRGGTKTRLLEELADFLRLAAQQRPLVILLEDLQWADAASWDALEYLLTQIESERILVVLTLQTESRDDDALDRWRTLVGRPRHHEMQLTRLTRDDVKRWLEGAMRTGEAGRDLLAYLYRHTAGNPLLLIQMIRDLEESGHIVRRDDGWHWSPVASLPPLNTIDDLLARRIDRLPPQARRMLEAAAVLGHEADDALLSKVTGLALVPARQTIQRLLASGLFVSTNDRERTMYAVAHDEIARVGRDRLDPPRRAALHGAVARALSTRGGEAAEVAGHFERAGDRAEAHRYALAGADEALAVHENAAVADLLAAASRTAPSAADLAAVRVRMASVAELGGRYEEAESLCDQALDWYDAQGDRRNAVSVKRIRSNVRIKRGQGARETLAELLALETEAAEVGADNERTAILLVVAQMHWRLGDVRAAQRVAEQAVATAERGDDQTLLADACNRLATTLQLEDPPRTRRLYDKALEIATALGDPLRRLRQLNNIGVLEMLSNNWDEARRMLTMAADSARTSGLIENWGRAELNLGVLAARIGDYAGAGHALSEALRITSMVQASEDQLYATYNLAHLEREMERYVEAISTYELVTELAERIGQVEVQAGALAGGGLCHMLVGDSEAARQAWQRARPLMDQLKDWFQGRELLEGLELHILLLDGNVSDAARVYGRALEMSGGSDNYGAAWLTAEFGPRLRLFVPDVIEAAVSRYGSIPEVLGNPYIRERFAVLKSDS
jgi:tetratricopeptide (TPR) repeat protein/GGDEF domain-containing protein